MKRKDGIIFLLFLVFAGLARQEMKGPTVAFAAHNLVVHGLVYCDLGEVLCEEQRRPLLSSGSDGLGARVAGFYESEFKRVTGASTKFTVEFKAVAKRGRIEIIQPHGLFDTLDLYWRLISEFRRADLAFFRSDARLFINIVKKNPADRSESSVGSANGRIGLVEWAATREPREQLWNLTKVLHELGHIWGTLDHYEASSKSHFPDGYVEPNLGDHSTQRYIDIMSGTRPVAGQEEAVPEHIEDLRVSPETARELGWHAR